MHIASFVSMLAACGAGTARPQIPSPVMRTAATQSHVGKSLFQALDPSPKKSRIVTFSPPMNTFV